MKVPEVAYALASFGVAVGASVLSYYGFKEALDYNHTVQKLASAAATQEASGDYKTADQNLHAETDVITLRDAEAALGIVALAVAGIELDAASIYN